MAVGSIGGTYGLSGSGLDIDAIVKKLMTGEQAKADALAQKKTVLQWQKAAYNTVYDDISTFRNTAFSYKLEGTLSPNKVSSSNTAVATATANASAAEVNHSLVVAQLASGVNLTSTASITPTSATQGTIANQIYGGTVPTGSFKVDIANGSAKATITVDTGGTLNDLVNQINNAGINVQASYDSTLDRFFMTTTNTGSSAEISITNSTSGDTSGTDFFVDKLKLSLNPVTTDGVTSYTSAGKDAVFQLDGVGLTEASNSFTISGITYNLTGVSTGTAQNDVTNKTFSGQATSISVTNDVDKAVSNIQSLVDSYNKILAELNSKVKETRYTDYPPLTDAQKAAMKDSDITLWNAKAQSGMLHNDDTLTSLISTMRNSFSSPVSGVIGTYNTAASIGITTGDYTEGGKLYLDTDKLRTALNANPNVLNQLFGASGTTTKDGKTTTDSKSQGIAGRLYDGIKKAMNQLNEIAGTTANAQYDSESNYALKIIACNKQISSESDKFDMMQKSYYTQYNALEVALGTLSSQSSWLSAQLSSSSS